MSLFAQGSLRLFLLSQHNYSQQLFTSKRCPSLGQTLYKLLSTVKGNQECGCICVCTCAHMQGHVTIFKVVIQVSLTEKGASEQRTKEVRQ